MSDVFDLIFDLFEWVVISLRSIPLSENVSLFDFSFALIIMSISISALVVSAKSSSLGAQSAHYRDKRNAERQQSRKGS